MNLPSNLFLLISTSSLGIKKLKYILQLLYTIFHFLWTFACQMTLPGGPDDG